jgi:hypothetical protein
MALPLNVFYSCLSCRVSTLKDCAEKLKSSLVNVNIRSKNACAKTRTQCATGSQMEKVVNGCCTTHAAETLSKEIQLGVNDYLRPILQGGGDEVRHRDADM